MIQPVQTSRGSFSSIAHRAAQAASEEPVDQVLPGHQSVPDVIKRQAPVSKTAHIMGREIYEYRTAAAPLVFTLARKLHDKELKGQDFQLAAGQLRQIAMQSPDPLARDLAQAALARYFKWSDNATDWAAKLGPVEGPTEALESLFGQADPSRGGVRFSETHIPPHLEQLARATEEYTVPEKSVRALAHGARILYRRSESELTQTIREHESPEANRAWARQCVDLLERWWELGDLAVARDGRPVAQGELDLEQAFSGDLVVEVRASLVDFRTPRTPTPEAVQLFKEIPGWPQDPAPGVDRLCRLALEQPHEARRLVDELVELQMENGPLWSFTRLLSESADRPVLKTLLEPHGPTLTTFAERHAGRWHMVNDQDRLVDYYRTLFRCLPDLATPEVVERQFQDVKSFKLPELVGELCEGKPELAAACARVAFHREGRFLRHGADDILTAALEKGWEPQPEQLQQLADQLVGTRFTKEQSLLRGDFSRDLLRLCARIQDRHPHCWDGIEIPDSRGLHQPVRRAVLDHLLNDPETDLARYHPGSSFGRDMTDVYRWISPDPAVAATLLTGLDGVLPGQPLGKQPDSLLKSVVILAALPLDSEDDERLVGFLRPFRASSPGGALNDILDRYRVSRFEPEAVRAFQEPGRSLEARVEAGTEFLLVNQESFSRWSLDNRDRMNAGLEAFAEAVAGHSDGELTELSLRLVREVNAEAAGLEKTTDLSARSRARLLLAGQVAAQNSQRMDLFLRELAPLREKESYGAVRDMYERFDSMRVNLDWGEVKQAILDQDSLEEQADAIRAYLNRPDGGGRPHEALELFTELVDRRGPAAPAAWMVKLLTPVVDGYGPGLTRTGAHAVEVRMAEELVGGDDDRRRLLESMLEPFLLGPLGNDPVGQRFNWIRERIIDRSAWPLMERSVSGDERVELLRRAWKYATAAGTDAVEKLSRYFVTWRNEEDQHWSSRLLQMFPDCKDNVLLARMCLEIGSEGDLELFREVFEKLNGPDRPGEILQGFERARTALEAGADRERALWHALIENLAAPGQEPVAAGTIDAADDVVQVADFALDIRD